eukprot:TRINITY_DN112492_c0_g1_i1.p1 TRINITY_DN112492_c0_g1~~TRINITY_DN112492_c0_g1_i1.p1  ORF type:complete len:444 (-),score=56.52 TRINITY_DN112492_c0_g1_i1:35-1366(-)
MSSQAAFLIALCGAALAAICASESAAQEDIALWREAGSDVCAHPAEIDDAEAVRHATSLLQMHQQHPKLGTPGRQAGQESTSCCTASSNSSSEAPSHWHSKIRQYYGELQENAAVSNALIQRAAGPVANSSWGDVAELVVVLQSGKAFYNTRLDWISKTWATKLGGQALVAVGDSPALDGSIRVQGTRCPASSHGQGGCCKMAEAAIAAYDMMQKIPSLQWAYLADDDTYVRVPQLLQKLKTLDPRGESGKGAAYGLFVCTSARCATGLCGGGGYALSRLAVESMVGSDGPAKFLREQMDTCSLCDEWADIAMSQVMRANLVSQEKLDGLHAWRMKKDVFDETLKETAPEPLVYHYIRSQGQMTFLHDLFHPRSNATTSTSNLPQDRCATYRSNTHCASPAAAMLTQLGFQEALPWDSSAIRSLMSPVPLVLWLLMPLHALAW